MKKIFFLCIEFMIVLCLAWSVMAVMPYYQLVTPKAQNTCIAACGIAPTITNLAASYTYELCVTNCEPIFLNITNFFRVHTFFDVFMNLQKQIKNISLTPGPQGIPGLKGDVGPAGNCSCDARIAALEERVAALEVGGIPTCTDGLIKSCYTGPAGTVGVGICKPGTMTCVQGTWGSCKGQIIHGNDNNCNGIDEDCNGINDDHYVQTQTNCGVGACASQGQMVCKNGQLVDTCVPGTPQTEVCDGVDNDCDGLIDNNCTVVEGNNNSRNRIYTLNFYQQPGVTAGYIVTFNKLGHIKYVMKDSNSGATVARIINISDYNEILAQAPFNGDIANISYYFHSGDSAFIGVGSNTSWWYDEYAPDSTCPYQSIDLEYSNANYILNGQMIAYKDNNIISIWYVPI